ncbi:MAG: hypothetical protein IK955_01715 [Clostridia bacterium]|nr:hypothetical protein [Clostridia bacterium]
MKKIASFLIAAMMLFVCVSCEKEPEDLESLDKIQVTYSIKNGTSGDFIVEIQEILSHAEPYKSLYSPDGLYIKMSNKAKIYDENGNEIKQKDLVIGDTLEIYYDGTLESNSPKTIKAYKIVRIA